MTAVADKGEIEINIIKNTDMEVVYTAQAIPPRPTPLPARSPAAERPRPAFGQLDFDLQHSLTQRARIFREDALRYAERESDAVYTGDFQAYYTTYRALPTKVLEGYFGWRTRLRRGAYTDAPLSFKFLYAYELLGCIGVNSPEAGFAALDALRQHYRERVLTDYLDIWLRDFAVYYALDERYVARAFDEVRRTDRLRAALKYPDKYGSDEVFDALSAVSSYDVTRSPFYKAQGEVCREALSRVYRAVCASEAERGTTSFQELFCGVAGDIPYQMFRNAVFIETQKHPDATVEIDDVRRYICRFGRWRCECLGVSGKQPGKSAAMGELLHEGERIAREVFGFARPLKPNGLKKRTLKTVQRAVEDYYQERKQSSRPAVSVDRSLLSGIRSDAALTMERLLIEEDEPENAALSPIETETVRAPAEAAVLPSEPAHETEHRAAPPAGLTEDERQFLLLLLEGEPWQSFTSERRLFPSLLADSINEKLFELIGDTVLESDGGDGYAVVEDYREDLLSIFG